MDVKKRTHGSISAAPLGEARDMGLSISGNTETALEQAVRLVRARCWREKNAAAIAERQGWIQRNRLQVADVQVMRP